jgi:hypothetical protein
LDFETVISRKAEGLKPKAESLKIKKGIYHWINPFLLAEFTLSTQLLALSFVLLA